MVLVQVAENRMQASERTGSPYLIVAGDFVRTGGMDRCNYALASYLADRGDQVHLASHRVAETLLARPNVHMHRIPKPLNSYILGNPLIHRIGRKWARRIAAQGGRVVVNGGNCDWGDVNWLHHINVADPGRVSGSWPREVKDRISRRIWAEEERRIVPRARLVIATCEKTSREAVSYLGVDPERIAIVYLGIDP
ncbi:MAG TPA: glycosyltransferase family 4 protein, partial [Isosphaeraceae bacterium]|nr:glycosyltransferase family 4 protein [Isosphaeraceae bacterium]